MEDLTTLVQTTLSEIEKMLSTKAVVGEAVTTEGKTFVPLVSVGFCFGAGGGQAQGGAGGKGKGEAAGGEGKGEGGLAFTAGGGGVKPVAVVVIEEHGVRVEPVRGSFSSVVETFVEQMPTLVDKARGTRKKEQET